MKNMKNMISKVALIPVVTAFAFAASTGAANASPGSLGGGEITTNERTQISIHTATGHQFGTSNQHESRPGLSISKLYIADYVYKHGTAEDKAKADQMIRVSDDGIANELYAKYPNSISATAAEYGLENTHAAPHWGHSTTSAYDSAKYVEAKKKEPGFDRNLLAMSTASPVAADGHRQDYGTATLPGVIGTKWGWSDDRVSQNASVSFGPGFTISANTYGTSADNTADVRNAFLPSPSLPNLPGLPNVPGLDLDGVIGSISGIGDGLSASLR